MSVARPWLVAATLCVSLLIAAPARAIDLPPTCASNPGTPDNTSPIAELRKQVEGLSEQDPVAVVRLLCATIPRVAREYGEDSVEYAWWLGSLATPLIAYMDKFAEALPLMDAAQAIFEKQLGRDAVELADIHVAHAWINYRQGKLADAGKAWEEALRIREIHPGVKKIELQKALVGLAQVQSSQRDFDNALKTLDRAHAILVENGDTVSEAAAAIENVYTNIAVRQEDYLTARRHAETLLDIERQLAGGAPQLVPGHVLLGFILERLDEFEAAEAELREAIRLSEAEQGPLQRHQLRALTQLGALLNERGRPSEALPVATRAIELGEATLGPDAPTLVRILQINAETHRTLGELPEALEFYQRADDIVGRHRSDVERQVLVAHYRGLGGLQLSLGDGEHARQSLTTGLETAGTEQTLSLERAQVLLQLARLSAIPAPNQSRAELAQALDLFRARLPDSHPTLLRVINEICGIELAADPVHAPHCDDAAKRLEHGREIEPALRSAVYGNQSQIAEARGNAADAQALAIREVSAATTLGTPDPLWKAYFHLARLLLAQQERSLAIMFGKQSIAQIERLRGYFVGEYRRFDAGFLRDKVSVYRAVADWLMEAGRIDEALDVLRLLKTEELYDFALRDASFKGGDRGVELTGDEAASWQRYSEALEADAAAGAEIDRLSRLREAGRLSVTEQRRLEELLAGQRSAESARAERIRAFLAQDTARTAPRDVRTREVRAEGLAREMQRFGPDTALAFYLMTEDRLRVLVATRAAQSEHQVQVAAVDLSREVGRFLDAIAQRGDVRAQSRELYETIARPVDEAAERAGARRLVLWLDGALRYVPFGALHDGERYLVEKYALQNYAESANIETVRAATARTALRVRGLGVTRAVAGYDPLPAVADELCYIVRGPITGLELASSACPQRTLANGAIPGEGFADTAFTEARFRSLLDGPRQFSVLHLGTHFSLRPGNALRSFLVLGDGSRLTLDAIGALDFGGVELMTLSACQTGMGGAITDDGREVEGLSALVQRRGARRVVASLWQVEDESTARLMQSMYNTLSAAASDAARALQRAQLSVRSYTLNRNHPYEHPYYWAGFVISGSAL
jgi:CHAT domain-containing protein/tetratricopeptide (TPR) repeat protein